MARREGQTSAFSKTRFNVCTGFVQHGPAVTQVPLALSPWGLWTQVLGRRLGTTARRVAPEIVGLWGRQRRLRPALAALGPH